LARWNFSDPGGSKKTGQSGKRFYVHGLDLMVVCEHEKGTEMKTFALALGWCLLLVLCWPLALLLLIAIPFIWVILLPFRLAAVCVSAMFVLLRALLFLPARLLGDHPARS
jgi:hypothetical protein